MRKIIPGIVFAALALVIVAAPCAHAEVLITKAEAELPTPTGAGAGATRGLTRGPGIEQLSPNPHKSMASPLPLLIKFVPRNDVEIDPASVKVTYLKSKPIDLTARIKRHVTADGIDMSQAEVPPGTHLMRIEVTDKQGRKGSTVIKLNVAAR
jgi:hypothetical protein